MIHDEERGAPCSRCGQPCFYLSITCNDNKHWCGDCRAPWQVYIVECSDGSYYTGITNDLDSRIKKHNSGKGAKYTKTRLPVKLLKSFDCETKSEALKLEYKIKQLPKDEKLTFQV